MQPAPMVPRPRRLRIEYYSTIGYQSVKVDVERGCHLLASLEIGIGLCVVPGLNASDDLPVNDRAKVCVPVGMIAEMQDFGLL